LPSASRLVFQRRSAQPIPQFGMLQ
jgi:hypothetical protein